MNWSADFCRKTWRLRIPTIKVIYGFSQYEYELKHSREHSKTYTFVGEFRLPNQETPGVRSLLATLALYRKHNNHKAKGLM